MQDKETVELSFTILSLECKLVRLFPFYSLTWYSFFSFRI